MTVRVERTFAFDAPPERIWAFIADPEKRAEAITVADSWERNGDETIWHISLPIPLVDRTVAVRTRDIERVENKRVRFTGRSSVMTVEGTHEINRADSTTHLSNRFVVNGKLPGVERFFERNLDAELDNLERDLRRDIDG
ncbi:MAG: SRPBCC family protein [Halobacteriales archaeon]